MPETITTSSSGPTMRSIVDSIKASRQERARKAIERSEFVKQMQADTARLLKVFNDLQEQIRKDNVRRKAQTAAALAQHQAELKAAVRQLSQSHQQLMQQLRSEHKDLQLTLKQRAIALHTALKANEQTRLQQQQALMKRIHTVIRSKQEEVQRLRHDVFALRQQAQSLVKAFAEEHRHNQAVWAELRQHPKPSAAPAVSVAASKAISELSELEKQFAINIPFVKPKK